MLVGRHREHARPAAVPSLRPRCFRPGVARRHDVQRAGQLSPWPRRPGRRALRPRSTSWGQFPADSEPYAGARAPTPVVLLHRSLPGRARSDGRHTTISPGLGTRLQILRRQRYLLGCDVNKMYARRKPVTALPPTRSPSCATPPAHLSVAVLDVVDPGLAGGHPLVGRGQRDHSGPLVGASLGSIAFRVHALALFDGHG